MNKGPLIAVGGKLDLSSSGVILDEFIRIVKEKKKSNEMKVGILPTASQKSEKTSNAFSEAFEKRDVEPVTINPETREEANDPDIIDKAMDVDAYFFTGGNQLRITTILGGTDLAKTIRKRHENGIAIGGTSAGAVCLTNLMIAYGESKEALMTGVLELTHGLHFLPKTVIDTHFTARGRFPRLVHVVVENPITLGIGLGENTAAFWDFKEGIFEVIGERNILVVDGENIKHTNVSELSPGTPIHAEGITVHILSDGCKFDIKEKKPIFPKNE